MSQDIFPKFIIEKIDDQLKFVMGKCTYHRELACDIANVIGGGWFRWDHADDEAKNTDKVLILFGSSDQFGSCKTHEIQEVFNTKQVFRDRFDRDFPLEFDRYQVVFNACSDLASWIIYDPEPSKDFL